MNIHLNSNMFRGGVFRAKRHKFGVFTLLMMLFLGAGFTVGGLLFINVIGKTNPSWTITTGEVVGSSRRTSDGSTSYAAIVRYQVDGQTYQTKSSLSSSSVPTNGDEREVAYNPSQPNQAKVIESIALLWIFPIIGLVMLALAPILFIRSLKRSSTIKNLMQTGQKLPGVLTDIQSITSGNGGYRIVVSATDPTGTVQHYTSDSVTGIGSLTMADFRNNPIPIDVYIDPTNPQNYYVDIADIPNLTPERITQLLQSATQKTQSPSVLSAQQPTTPPADNVQPPFPPKL